MRQCARSEKQLEKCLRSLPQSLDATYERILSGIGDESRDEAQQILSLLCFAVRPLTVDEVIEASAIDIDDLECYDADRKFTDLDDLLRLCPGLIEIDAATLLSGDESATGNSESLEEDEQEGEHTESSSQKESEHSEAQHSDGDLTEAEGQAEHTEISSETESEDSEEQKPDDEDDGEDPMIKDKRDIRIAHFSVQEYLMSARIQTSRVAIFAMSGPQQHFRICKACLIYLHNDSFVRQTFTYHLIQQYSWASYAAAKWINHYRQASEELVQELSPIIIRLFTDSGCLDHWLRLYDVESESERTVLRDIDTCIPPLYHAAALGLNNILDDLLSGPAACIDAHGGEFGTPLGVAIYMGFKTTAALLLDRGANINARTDPYIGTALLVACIGGNTEIVKFLLDRGADVNMQSDRFGVTALVGASCMGQKKIVELLLDRGADVNLKTERGDTALTLAVSAGSEKIVRLLLARGVDVNVSGVFGTALGKARSKGYRDIEALLLENGAKEAMEPELEAAETRS